MRRWFRGSAYYGHAMRERVATTCLVTRSLLILNIYVQQHIGNTWDSRPCAPICIVYIFMLFHNWPQSRSKWLSRAFTLSSRSASRSSCSFCQVSPPRILCLSLISKNTFGATVGVFNSSLHDFNRPSLRLGSSSASHYSKKRAKLMYSYLVVARAEKCHFSWRQGGWWYVQLVF
jgi:hypothetical protein